MFKFLKKNKSISLLFTLLSVSLLSIWISGRTIISGPKELGFLVASLFQNAFTSIGTTFSNTANSIQKLYELQHKYDDLSKLVQIYQSRQIDLEQLRNENDNLKNLLQFKSAINYQTIAAKVIATSPGTLFTTYTLDKGFNDGISTGMPVVAVQDNITGLVGKISATSPYTCQIQPVYSDDFYIAARMSSSRYEGLVHGAGTSNSLFMQFVDTQAQTAMAIGEPVMTSSNNSIYPEGLRIGTVAAINARPYENSLELELKPAVQFSKLEYAFVIIYLKDQTKK